MRGFINGGGGGRGGGEGLLGLDSAFRWFWRRTCCLVLGCFHAHGVKIVGKSSFARGREAQKENFGRNSGWFVGRFGVEQARQTDAPATQ